MSNKYNGAHVTFLSKKNCLSFLEEFLLILIQIFYFPWLALKVSKDYEWLKSNKWSLAVLSLGLSFFLLVLWDSDMLPNSCSKVSCIFTIIEFTPDFINDTKCKFFRNSIFKTKSIWLLNTICNLQQLIYNNLHSACD